jgi:hypothetical protein
MEGSENDNVWKDPELLSVRPPQQTQDQEPWEATLSILETLHALQTQTLNQCQATLLGVEEGVADSGSREVPVVSAVAASAPQEKGQVENLCLP